MSNLYEKLGGEAAVDAAVDIFYRKVLSDERISDFFTDVDMDLQIAKQKAFLTYAFGGPVKYTGQSMKDGHAHLVKRGLNDTHVDIVISLLAQTLQELSVSSEDIGNVATIAESVRGQILGREG